MLIVNIVAFGRAFLGMTMAFHIAFALFGVGIPLMISVVEFIGIWKKDEDFLKMAKHWTFALVVLFVAGSISGTIVAVVFAVLLPAFMAIVSKVIILPFYAETFAFFIEAIFLGIYMHTWKKLRPWTHWLVSIPIAVGALASAFFITTVNAFMSAPQGFTDANGVISNVDQIKAMFNPAVPTRTTHSILAYYATTAFVFAAVTAWTYLKKRKTGAEIRPYMRKMLVFSMVMSILFSFAVVISGDSSVRYIAANEPEKFAAAEGIIRTQSDAPITVGGYFDSNNNLHDDLSFPGMLSFMLGGSENTVVRGLDTFDPSTWPPLIVHDLFDAMVVIGILMAVIPIAFFILYICKKKYATSSPMLISIIAIGWLSVVAVEVGWMLTEIGRQPYVIQGVLLTKDAFTTSSAAITYAITFPILYIILSAVTLWALASHYRAHHFPND